MKTLLILICICLSACSLPYRIGPIRVGHGPIGKLAMNKEVKGKFRQGECLTFALDLHKKFKAAGFQSKVVAYSWAEGFEFGAHAFLMYEDDGRIYGIDNLTWSPKWLGKGTLEEKTIKFNGSAIMVMGAAIIRE